MKKYQNLDKQTLVEIVGGGATEDFNTGRTFVRILRYILGGH